MFTKRWKAKGRPRVDQATRPNAVLWHAGISKNDARNVHPKIISATKRIRPSCNHYRARTIPVVLDSLAHPLRREEKAVDLTAMLLGFRNLYESGCYKEERLYNGMAWQKMGYLSKEEVQLANEILVPTSPNLFLMFTKSRFAKILFVMVVVAAWYGAVYGIPEHADQPSPRKAAEGKPSLPPGLAAIPQPGIPPGWLATLGAR
jgi:hypothetical protein